MARDIQGNEKGLYELNVGQACPGHVLRNPTKFFWKVGTKMTHIESLLRLGDRSTSGWASEVYRIPIFK